MSLSPNYPIGALTPIQRKKWLGFLEVYPAFARIPTKEIVLTSSDIGKALSSKSCNVIRDLQRISRRLNNIIRIQEGTKDSRNNFVPIHPDLNPREQVRKRGRQKNTSREKGFKGNSVWIKLWLSE